VPLYEYVCQGCGLDFEELVFSRTETIACPECSSADVARKMSAFAIHGQRADGSSASASSCSKGSCGGCSSQGCGCGH